MFLLALGLSPPGGRTRPWLSPGAPQTDLQAQPVLFPSLSSTSNWWAACYSSRIFQRKTFQNVGKEKVPASLTSHNKCVGPGTRVR